MKISMREELIELGQWFKVRKYKGEKRIQNVPKALKQGKEIPWKETLRQ